VTFCKQKNILMRFGWPIFAAFRHRIRLVPDDIRAQPPARVLQRKGQPPRHTNEVFLLEPSDKSVRSIGSFSVFEAPVADCVPPVTYPSACVGVAHVDPRCSVLL